ncbi:MAG: endolytic transglycosylase MltG [Hasllibacter sp.]
MWKAVASNALTVLIVGLIAAAAGIAWARAQWQEPGPLAQGICLRVESGSNMRRVSLDLAERGAVSSARIYRSGVRYADLPGLKAGAYLIPEGASMAEIADIVTRGGASTCGTEIVYLVGVNALEARVRELDPATETFEIVAEFGPDDPVPPEYEEVRDRSDTRFRVAVAEGVTSWQVVQGLAFVDVLEGEIAEIPAEGVLAPDSYEVARGTTRGEVIEAMRQSQEEILAAAWEGRAEGLPLESPEEALILASIIEKETGVPEERRQVASVFVNRLRQGMRLQTDPTVIYGVTRGEGVLGRGLRQSELERETPWNTYVIDGLPPTPIANPGRASIEAALNPDETPYVFFVADGTGGHAFAETLAEHNENVRAWRAIEAEREPASDG